MISCLELGLKKLWKTRSELVDLIPSNSVGIELGVYHGICARYILDNASVKEMFLVDIWTIPGTKVQHKWDSRYNNTKKIMKKELNSGKVKIYKMDTHDAASMFDDDSIDWIHGDSGVRYNHIKPNLELYWPKLKRGGYFVIRGFTPSNPVNGVHIAIDELRASNDDVELVGLTDDKDFSISIVMRKK